MDDLPEEEPPKWYEEFGEEIKKSKDVSEDELTSLRIEAQNVLEEETKIYNSKIAKGKKQNDANWIKTVLTKGTAGDKVAALVVTIQNSPVHNLSALTTLVNMVKVGKKKQCVTVMEVLSELFLSDLLKPEVKLKTFANQPLAELNQITKGVAMARRKRLSAWLFEEKLKELYQQFINALDIVAKDTVENNREKAITTMYQLLAGHPEQEQILLSNIVNKMGDPSQKVASKVIYCLTQLLRIHSNMKMVVMNEVEKLMFRTNISNRTQYYGICFLSQFVFKEKDRDVARNIINIYFSFFKALTKKGEVDTRLMSALLMGVKRSFPYAKLEHGGSEVLNKHINTLYKIVHISNFNIALHTLCLLQQVSSTMEDRFYSALYRKLLDPQLLQSTHHAILINLLYKSLSKDTNISRIKALIKRILQLCLYLPVPLVCGMLYMISQILSRKNDTLALELTEVLEVKFEDNDGEEKYFDVDKINDAEEGVTEKQKENPDVKPAAGWYFCDLTKKQKSEQNGCYDPKARNPAFANADKTAYTELLILSKHFHPTVSLFATKLLSNELILYGGDPLTDFTLARFLERFVFKNPKKLEGNEGGRGPDPHLAMRKYYEPSGARAMSVTSAAYLQLNETNVPVEELFLHRYLKEKFGEDGMVKRTGDDDDNDSVASEDFEEMLQGLMQKSGKADLNFIEDIGDNLSANQKKKKGGKRAEEESEDEEEEDEEEVDEEEEGSGDEEMVEDDDFGSEISDFEDNDDEVMEFSDDDAEFDGELDFDEAFDNSKSNKTKTKKKPQKVKKAIKPRGKGLEGLFAPAEEFAEMLEEAGADTSKPGMAHSVKNTDNAAPKQLKWEQTRNQWIKGYGKNKRKKGGAPFKKGKKFKR